MMSFEEIKASYQKHRITWKYTEFKIKCRRFAALLLILCLGFYIFYTASTGVRLQDSFDEHRQACLRYLNEVYWRMHDDKVSETEIRQLAASWSAAAESISAMTEIFKSLYPDERYRECESLVFLFQNMRDYCIEEMQPVNSSFADQRQETAFQWMKEIEEISRSEVSSSRYGEVYEMQTFRMRDLNTFCSALLRTVDDYIDEKYDISPGVSMQPSHSIFEFIAP